MNRSDCARKGWQTRKRNKINEELIKELESFPITVNDSRANRPCYTFAVLEKSRKLVINKIIRIGTERKDLFFGQDFIGNKLILFTVPIESQPGITQFCRNHNIEILEQIDATQ